MRKTIAVTKSFLYGTLKKRVSPVREVVKKRDSSKRVHCRELEGSHNSERI
jgi:hypothetical protein